MLPGVATQGLRPGLLLALLAVLVAPLVLPASARPAHARVAVTVATLDEGVLEQLNAIRELHGLVPLRPSAQLTASAVAHSEEMAADGYFEHRSADGTAFWRRIERWYPDSDFPFWSVGENLLWSSPGVDPSEALRLWMRSPEHRANILAPRWRQIGVAAVHVDAAPGTYHGLPVTIITTDFGVRR
jgi:uncharacterized protein YkwD